MNGPVLTVAGAADAGLRKDQLYALVEAGELERIGRGVFVDPDRVDPAWAALAAASALKPASTLCLTSSPKPGSSWTDNCITQVASWTPGPRRTEG